MNTDPVSRTRLWLESFARTHGWSESGCHRMLEIKMEHTLRVAADCRGIAQDQGWSADSWVSAEIVGLLHDVARFPQFQRFRTFIDRDSFDHGEHGYGVLLQYPVLNAFPPETRDAILTGVRYHNRKQMPVNLAEPALSLLKLVRDADKLDILQVIRDVSENDDYGNHPELLLGKDKAGPPSAALITEILETRTGSYEHVHSLTDLDLLRLTWIYDLNYPSSLQRLKSRNLYRDLLGARHADPRIELIKDRVREELRQIPAA